MPCWATHILGGEMSYAYLGNDDYQVTLVLYRDCGPDNVNNTALDFQAAIGVFNSAGMLVQTVHFTLPSEVNVPVVVTNPCLVAPPSICAKMGTYTGVIHLPSGAGSYTLTYQRCCRSPVVANISTNPPQGMTVTVQVPDPDVTGANNSPTFQYDTPTVLCLDQTFTLDQLAVDPDGDSLVYSMCAPLLGGDDVLNVIPDPPSAPPYSPVLWAAGFSTANQLNSDPPAVFSTTNDGLLTVHPTTIGSFAVSLCVSEYRNGVLLNTLIRDFRFLVVNCGQPILSDFLEQQATCDGLTVQFHNESTGSTDYLWNFGVQGTFSDTSTATEPEFTFPASGSYTVTLIASPGVPCADTSSHVFTVQDPLAVAFTPPPTLCPDDLPYPMVAFGNFGPDAEVAWHFGDGTSPDTLIAGTTVDFTSLGSHAVSVSVLENGCTASFADSVRVFPLPTAVFTADSMGCAPFQPIFTNGSEAWTPMSFLWQFGDGTYGTDSIPQKEYAVPGTYTVSLTTTTTEGCIASVTQTQPNVVEVWPQPRASAIALPQVTTVLDPEVQFIDNSIDATTWDFLLEGVHYDTPSFTHSFSEAGWQTAYLTVTSGNGCTDTTSVRVFIGGHLFFAPSAFSPNGDGMNEVWKPSVVGAREYQLDIFDRWGHDVFSTTDPSQGWDGKNATPGMYSYKAWLTEYGPLEREYNGSFVLIK